MIALFMCNSHAHSQYNSQTRSSRALSFNHFKTIIHCVPPAREALWRSTAEKKKKKEVKWKIRRNKSCSSSNLGLQHFQIDLKQCYKLKSRGLKQSALYYLFILIYFSCSGEHCTVIVLWRNFSQLSNGMGRLFSLGSYGCCISTHEPPSCSPEQTPLDISSSFQENIDVSAVL